MIDAMPGEAFYALFQVHPDGVKVFEELCARFYDKQSYTKGDSHHTAYLEGQRSVLFWLINKMQTTTKPEELEDEQSCGN
jgi:hypothetical protein